MRVRPAGQSSSLAVSGSLGGCDANTSKAISEDVPSPSIDCEAHSAAGNLHIPGSYFLFLSLSFALPKIAIFLFLYSSAHNSVKSSKTSSLGFATAIFFSSVEVNFEPWSMFYVS